jgi:hypothetical protein
MKTYDLYGYNGDADIHAARGLVENAIGIQLAAHDSSYHGGEYYRNGLVGSENFILKRNHDPHEDEWTEPQYKSCPLLLYVNATLRPRELEKMLSLAGNFKLLKREEL